MLAVATLIAQLNDLGAYLKYQTGNPLARPGASEQGWLREIDLANTAHGAQVRILEELARRGFGGNRRALSASVMLRYGWSSGFLIGLYLMSGRVVRGADLALRFTREYAALAEVSVISCEGMITADDVGADALRVALSDELIARSAPIVEAHHHWSGFSRKALWSMVTSSWASQFTHVSEKLGDPDRGLREAEAVLGLDHTVEAASPDLYMVHAEGKRGVCQMRRLCCLWFKGEKRQFCTSCPIIPIDDRMERNRKWIAQRGMPEAGGGA